MQLLVVGVAAGVGARTLVATAGVPDENLWPSLLAVSDVMGTGGIGADAILECVGTDQAMRQAVHAARPGGSIGFVGLPTGSPSTDGSCSSPRRACAAAPPPCAATCPT